MSAPPVIVQSGSAAGRAPALPLLPGKRIRRHTALAMSEENVQLARSAILRWNERGVDALLEALDPGVEFHPPKESMEPGVYRGHSGVRDYFDRLARIVEEQRVESVDVID